MTKKRVGIVVVVILLLAGFHSHGYAKAYYTPAFALLKWGDTVESISSQQDIEYFDRMNGSDIYLTNIIYFRGVRLYNSSLAFGFRDNKFESIRFIVNKEYPEMMERLLMDYGEPVVHVLDHRLRRLTGAEDIIIRWSNKDASAIMYYEWNNKNVTVVIATHAEMEILMEPAMEYHLYDITFDEFLSRHK